MTLPDFVDKKQQEQINTGEGTLVCSLFAFSSFWLLSVLSCVEHCRVSCCCNTGNSWKNRGAKQPEGIKRAGELTNMSSTAVAAPAFGVSNKENAGAAALAGSLSQINQKVAAADDRSFCKKLDETKGDAANSYAQLQGIFADVKAKYIAASTKLHFLNLLSADVPLDEIQPDTQDKLQATRKEVALQAEQARQDHASTHQQQRAAVASARALLTQKIEQLKQKMASMASMPSSLATLQKLKASTFDEQNAKIQALKQQKAALEQQVQEATAKKHAAEQRLQDIVSKRSGPMIGTGTSHSVGSSSANRGPAFDAENRKSQRACGVVQSTFGAAVVTTEKTDDTAGISPETHTLQLHIGQTDTKLTVDISEANGCERLTLTPLLVRVDDIVDWANQRCIRNGTADNHGAILAWIVAEVKTRLLNYVPGTEPVVQKHEQQAAASPEAQDQQDLRPSPARPVAHRTPAASARKQPKSRRTPAPATAKKQARTPAPNTNTKRKQRTPATAGRSKRKTPNTAKKIATPAPQASARKTLASKPSMPATVDPQTSTETSTTTTPAATGSPPRVGTIDGAIALTSGFVDPSAKTPKNNGASTAAAAAAAAAAALDDTVEHQSDTEGDAAHTTTNEEGDLSLMSRRIAELDDSAAAFRPTRTIPRD